ncbi:MAG: hypothetical protein JW704_10125 [Anaerolineaceae bacterium]|nr:hypothetical protein [Anaerolineaceae bacterium]
MRQYKTTTITLRRVVLAAASLLTASAILLALQWLLATPAQAQPEATTRYVALTGSDLTNTCADSGTPCRTVQHTVDEAQPGDEIRVATGVYTDVHVRAGITQVVYISKTVTVRGGYTTSDWDTFNPEANPTTLDVQGLGRVLVITGTITPIVEGLRITGGDATGLGSDSNYDAGGGVYAQSTMATFNNCIVYSNTASTGMNGYGGGMYARYSTIVLLNNTIANNTASTDDEGRGGGLYLDSGRFTLQSNTIVSNTASTVDSGHGGGVCLSGGSGTLSDNTVAGNVASKGYQGFGGGAHLFTYEYYTLTNNIFLNNPASTASNGYGGGLYLDSDATLENNTFVYNIASTASSGYGGGLGVNGSDITFSLNTVISNTASTGGQGRGGGLHIDGGSLVFSDNTVQYNTASMVDRGYGGGAWVAGDATLTGNLVADNTASKGYIGYGGGLNLRGANRDLWIVNNTIARNTATTTSDGGYGGGLYLYHGSPTLDGNAILSNTASTAGASYGGAVYAHATNPVTLTNNLAAGNRANTQGSGLFFEGFSPASAAGYLRHNTIASNLGSGQGVFVGDLTSLSFTNTIIVDHSAWGIYVSSGSTVTLEATLWGSGDWANGTDWGGPGAITTGTLNLWEEPGFVNPSNGDYHLAEGSFAIDSGIEAGVANDLDGHPRPIGLPDLGAYEWARRIHLPLVQRNW